MRKLLRAAIWLFAANTAAWLAGRYLGRRLSSGDAAADEFSLTTIYGGDTFSSTAPALRSGRVKVIMGGVLLDLRDATPAPTGAHVTLEVTMGGAMVRVSDEWRVSVEEDLQGADVHVDVTPPEALPDESPQLHLRVAARGGGITITAAPGKVYD